MERKNYQVTVASKVSDLATITQFFKETGIYSASKPSGVLSKAIEMFANSIRGNNLGFLYDEEQAMLLLTQYGFPMEPIIRKVSHAQVLEDRAAQRAEGEAMLGHSVAQGTALRSLREKVVQLTEIQRHQLGEKIMSDEELAAHQEEQKRLIEEQRNRAIEMGAKSGTMIMEGVKGTNEDITDEEYAARQEKKDAIERENMLNTLGITEEKAQELVERARKKAENKEKLSKMEYQLLGWTPQQIESYREGFLQGGE